MNSATTLMTSHNAECLTARLHRLTMNSATTLVTSHNTEGLATVLNLHLDAVQHNVDPQYFTFAAKLGLDNHTLGQRGYPAIPGPGLPAPCVMFRIMFACVAIILIRILCLIDQKVGARVCVCVCMCMRWCVCVCVRAAGVIASASLSNAPLTLTMQVHRQRGYVVANKSNIRRGLSGRARCRWNRLVVHGARLQHAEEVCCSSRDATRIHTLIRRRFVFLPIVSFASHIKFYQYQFINAAGLDDEPVWTVRCAFQQKFTLDDTIGSHACSLEALACV
jgi:hypothetical protein